MKLGVKRFPYGGYQGACVYKITSEMTGRVYVGASKRFMVRARIHRGDLFQGSHGSRQLQEEWNHYGSEHFLIEVIEKVENISELPRREQFWIDKLNTVDPLFGFNYLMAFPKRAYARKQDHPRLGKDCVSLAERRKIISQNSKFYLVCSPEGLRIAVHGLNQFCKTHGLTIAAMRKVLKGLKKLHGGWSCSYLTKDEFLHFQGEKWFFETDGDRVLGSRLSQKESNQIRGARMGKKFVVTSPSGVEMSVSNLQEFCRQNDVDHANLLRTAKYTKRRCKGWFCRYAD